MYMLLGVSLENFMPDSLSILIIGPRWLSLMSLCFSLAAAVVSSFFDDNLGEPDNFRCSLQNTSLVPEDVFHSSHSGHPEALESEHKEMNMKTECTFLTIDPAR